MSDIVLGFDTSNYTTSAAYFGNNGYYNSGMLLDVAPGELGLRQSDALFKHVKRIGDIIDSLNINGNIIAVGASSAPRETEGSYMPCFLAGVSEARVLSAAMHIPFIPVSHQQGHIAAAALSAGVPELLDKPMLAWHLSGGTTELLYVQPSGTNVKCEIIGATTDVSAGQLIDRTGQLLGLNFPAGKELDKLAVYASDYPAYKMKINGLQFSLSGVEHKVKQLAERGEKAENIAAFALNSIIYAVTTVTENAKHIYGDIPVLFSGGVSSNSLLRAKATGIFAPPRYSTDNALGVAFLTFRAVSEFDK